MKKNIILSLCLLIPLTLFFARNVHANKSDTVQTIVEPEEGIYTIAASADPNMLLEIADDSVESGANVQLGTNTNRSEQYFFISQQYNGWYTIQNVNSLCNLDITEITTNPKTNLQQYAINISDAQLFRFLKADDQSVYIQSKSETYIDLANGTLLPGTNIQLFSFNGSDAQKWQLQLIESTEQPMELEDGEYILYTDLQKTNALDIQKPRKLIGQYLTINECTPQTPQIFIIKKENDGWYTIKNKTSNLYLEYYLQDDIYYLRQWSGNGLDHQKFQFIDAGNGFITIKSKHQLTIQEYTDSSKTSITLYTGPTSQKWYFERSEF